MTVSLGKTFPFQSSLSQACHWRATRLDWSKISPAIIFGGSSRLVHSTLDCFRHWSRCSDHLWSNQHQLTYFLEAWGSFVVAIYTLERPWFGPLHATLFRFADSWTLNQALMTQNGVWSHKSRLLSLLDQEIWCSWLGFARTFLFIT